MKEREPTRNILGKEAVPHRKPVLIIIFVIVHWIRELIYNQFSPPFEFYGGERLKGESGNSLITYKLQMSMGTKTHLPSPNWLLWYKTTYFSIISAYRFYANFYTAVLIKR